MRRTKKTSDKAEEANGNATLRFIGRPPGGMSPSIAATDSR
jgi:hypothetical protein